jgi:glycine cleavage system aminomethyltransferase T
MSDSPALDRKSIFKIYAGSTELSPFHECYATNDTVLRSAAGRFFSHDNGDDHTEAYWALRQKVALYDVPERPLEISGPDAAAFLELVFARPLDNLKIGRGRYVIACTNNGGLFIDGILFRLADTRFWFVHPDGDMNTWLLAHSPGFDIAVTDPQSRVLQIQGPKSFDVMHAISAGAITSHFGYFHSGFFNIDGQQIYVSRTGWTGELGYEIYTQGDQTNCPRLWEYLMNVGASYGLKFGSMQSMNIRRIEAGILDSGSDFDISMTPFEAGLDKFVDFENRRFIGRDALLEARPGKRLYGLLCRDLTPCSGCAIFYGQTQVGVVTTGAQSPYLKAGVGYVRFFHTGEWLGKMLSLRCAGRGEAFCEIIDPPFYDREKRIPRAVVSIQQSDL